ncbi:outer membrane beta-barrel protein [Undibacterium sp.]|uniref:outer membrane beta-barrel protein n=1 Tax=Undibacterium sp. TaxID=1914977 RepID=UPI0025DC7599|nr:outer membrane beta-barrel protein [Undibacterium sp.]
MNKFLSGFGVALVIAASLSVATPLMAQQAYVGFAVMTPGEANLSYAPGKTVANADHLLAKKIYGGAEFDNPFALELGFLDWGYQFNVPTTGNHQVKIQEVDVKVNMLYLAGKASMPVSDNVKLFTKVGIARLHTDLNGTATANNLRGLVGFGMDYSMTKKIGLVVEFHRAGSINGVPQQKLEAGLKFTF